MCARVHVCVWIGECWWASVVPSPPASSLCTRTYTSRHRVSLLTCRLQVHIGDCVISVNGAFMLDLDYAAVVTAISKGGKKISLVLGSPEQMFEKDDVEEPPVT